MTKFPQEEGNSYRPEPTGRPEDLALHVLHSLDLPLCIIDSRDCYLFANKAYAARFGIGPESMHGMPVKELIGESLYEKRIKVLFARAREEGTAEFHGWVDYPRQGRRFVESEISLYEHPGLIGQKCVMVQSRDCTDREEQDRRRRKSLVFQETLLARIPALIWIADKGGNPYFYNESWLNFTGKTLVEQVREGWLSEVHPEDRQMILDRIQYAMENQDRVQIEFRLRHLTGGYRWVRLNGVPMIQGEPSSAEFIAAAVEIDDNKKHQEKMRAALEEERYLRNQALVQKAAADRANREKSAYLSLASHEIRTPLNPVIGFADLLASNPHLDADSKEMAQMILKAGKTLLTLLDEVLDFAKIEAGVLSLAPEPMDVHDLLMEIDNLYSFDAKSRGIELRVNDQISDGEELYEDRLRLEQILGALVSHAIRYTHKGYVEVTAETERVPLTGSSIQMLKLR